MSKAKKDITEADCACCGERHDFGQHTKSFTCKRCGVAQNVTPPQSIGYTRKRNRPEGFWA